MKPMFQGRGLRILVGLPRYSVILELQGVSLLGLRHLVYEDAFPDQ